MFFSIDVYVKYIYMYICIYVYIYVYNIYVYNIYIYNRWRLKHPTSETSEKKIQRQLICTAHSLINI